MDAVDSLLSQLGGLTQHLHQVFIPVLDLHLVIVTHIQLGHRLDVMLLVELCFAEFAYFDVALVAVKNFRF